MDYYWDLGNVLDQMEAWKFLSASKGKQLVQGFGGEGFC